MLCYTDWHKTKVHVRTCQCVHSIQMPALIVRQSHSYNSLHKNQDLWAASFAYQGPATWNDLPFVHCVCMVIVVLIICALCEYGFCTVCFCVSLFI